MKLLFVFGALKTCIALHTVLLPCSLYVSPCFKLPEEISQAATAKTQTPPIPLIFSFDFVQGVPESLAETPLRYHVCSFAKPLISAPTLSPTLSAVCIQRAAGKVGPQ